MTENIKPKITFAPGCFDHFDGTQEELDELVADIYKMFESGEYKEKVILLSDLDDDELQEILEQIPDDDTPRTLQ
jgi:hypothetical protein